MEKRIALYYPHTNINDEAALKRALLLWDNIEVIVPHEDYDFTSSYSYGGIESREVAESMELFGRKRVPTTNEKEQVHTAIEALTSQSQALLTPSDDQEFYEVYPQKFLGRTWQLLEDRHLRLADTQSADHAVSQNTGLVIMAMLADVLAGESRALYTDRTHAYETLWATLGAAEDTADLQSSVPLEQIVPLAFCNVNLADISLANVLRLRKREEEASGASLRTLRHNLQAFVASKAQELGALAKNPDANPRDIAEFVRQAESDLKDDATLLRNELRATMTQTVFSKDMLLPIVFGAASVANWALVSNPQLSGFTSFVAAGSLVAGRSKYLQQRLDIQKKHPTSYALHLRRQWL